MPAKLFILKFVKFWESVEYDRGFGVFTYDENKNAVLFRLGFTEFTEQSIDKLAVRLARHWVDKKDFEYSGRDYPYAFTLPYHAGFMMSEITLGQRQRFEDVYNAEKRMLINQ